MDNTVQYGQIPVKFCQRLIPTLETGRRSKHLILIGDEAIRREKRRERNREAARKLKEKRLLIEDELNRKLKDLEDKNSNLEEFLLQLKQHKQYLEYEIKNILNDPIEKLLNNINSDMPLYFEQTSDDFNLFEYFLNFDDNTNFDSILCN